MEIKAIIFDFDMTLVDTSHAIAYAMNRFAEIMGLRKV
ncbi:MAG TPA: HAD hydrolase-like protein, partial [Acetomicrobium sp.]|nr:HAD hydrolase-like protein [Acetomicrobium sp.]